MHRRVVVCSQQRRPRATDARKKARDLTQHMHVHMHVQAGVWRDEIFQHDVALSLLAESASYSTANQRTVLSATTYHPRRTADRPASCTQ